MLEKYEKEFLKINRQKLFQLAKEKNDINDEYAYCKYFYNYIINVCPDFQDCGFLKSIHNSNSILSGRNIACLGLIVDAAFRHDEKSYWHELHDFLHNYNSDTPISANECLIFVRLFEVGKAKWNEENYKRCPYQDEP